MSNPTLVHGKRQSLGKTIWKHRASYLLMAPYFILFFFFTVLPVLMAIGVSFTDWNMLEKPEFVGWQNYVKLLLDDEIFIISLKNTLIFAVITGPVSYMLCLLFAWIINEFNRGMRTLLTLIFYAPSICGNAYMVWNLILTGDRYGDDMEFLPDSPQEECYAIANCIDETFTHLITFPQNYQKYMDLAFEDGMTPEQRRRWCETHEYLLKKITYFRKGKRILFKSPDNTAKMGMLHDLYPEARFIHIYRDPYKVLMSTINMFTKEMGLFCLNDPAPYEVIEDVTIDLFERIYKKAFRELEEMPPEDHIDIKYEDFCKDPKGYVKLIYEHLGIDGFEEAKPYFDAYLESQKNYKKNKFELTPRLRDKINAKLGFYFEHYGYEMQK